MPGILPESGDKEMRDLVPAAEDGQGDPQLMVRKLCAQQEDVSLAEAGGLDQPAGLAWKPQWET